MKNVLILANDFPPLNSAGAQRAYSFFKYFKRYGYAPSVVTRHWRFDQVTVESRHSPSVERAVAVEKHEFGTVYRVPFDGDIRDRFVTRFGLGRMAALRRVLTVFIGLAKFRFRFVDNLNGVYREALKVCQERKIDVIIASGEPFVLFRQAALISKQLGIPWVADYRDGWSTHHLRTRAPDLVQRLLLGYERRLEIKTLRSATFFLSVSRYLVDQISELVGRPGFVVENGADLDFYRTDEVEPDHDFKVVYTGTLHDLPYVETVCVGFEEFIAGRRPTGFQVLFVGIEASPERPLSRVRLLAQRYPDVVQILPSVDPQRAAEYHREASVLLCLVAGSQGKGLMGAKLYGYAASRNPIISVPCEPDSGSEFFPGRDIQRLAFTAEEFSKLVDYYYARHLAKESLKTSITDEEVFSISREYQVRVLADLLDRWDISRREPEVIGRRDKIEKAGLCAGRGTVER